jgi:hypothetical protein
MESTFSQYEERICGVFRVHPIIAYTYAGIMSSTYSNAEQASKDFTDMVRVPLWNMIADQINEQLAIPDFGVEVGFDLSTVEALKPSVESQRTTALQAYQIGVMTLNEARETFGLEEVQGVAQTEVVTASRGTDVETKGGADVTSAGFRSDELDDATYFKAVDDISEKWAKRIAISYGKEVRNLEREILGSVKLYLGTVLTKDEGDPFDVEDWTARFLAATEDDRKGIVVEMIAAAASDVDAEDGEYGKARREGIDESSQKITASIGTIRDDVRFILNQSGGLSADEIAALLRKKFTEISEARANAIGRTTATATTGKTQSAVWKTVSDRESDPDRKIVRQWISFPGARDAHSKANGQWENLVSGMFTVGGEETEYPAGPFLSAKNAVNCRCITRARRKIDYDRATQGG